jgi:hypothetical protein
MNVLLAPNKKPSNLTPEQYKLVRTPAFKEWFGDWENDPENASKVVDSNGEPLVVYHATNNKFWEFSKEKQVVGYYGKGYYFSSSLEKAKDYGKRVIPAFLNIKSVFELSDETPQELLNELAEADIDVEDLGDDNDIEQRSKRTFGYASQNSDIFIANLMKNGFYGIKMDYDLESKIYFFIAFEPNQIKLADGSNTTFDSNNPDIRFDEGGLIAPNGKSSNLTPEQYKLVRTPAFKEWFGDWENDPENASKVVDSNGEPLVVFHGTDKQFNVFKKDPKNPYAEKIGYFFAFNKKYAESYNSKYVKECFINIRITGTYDDDDMLYPINADGVILDNLHVEVFDNKNIKLADGTNTTFNGRNPDIRFDEGGLIAPNGKSSNLTPEQYKLVRTPAFKEWFGDWENSPETASKVVDENGEPLVVWRGESKEFNKFDYKKLGSKLKTAWRKAGFYFSPTKKGAEQYMFFMQSGILKQFFLNIKNPYTYDSKEFFGVMDWGSLPTQRFKTNKSATDYANSQVEIIKNDNYDGFFVTILENDNVVEIVAFEPEQIKLADGSNTTFDGSNPDIRFDEGGLIAPNGKSSNLTTEQYELVRTPAFKEWFGDWENDPATASKVVDENGEPLVQYHFTYNKFTIFKNKESGFHFGDKSIEEDLAIVKGDNFNFKMNVFLSIKNPLRIEDRDRFYPINMVDYYLQEGIINANEYDYLLNEFDESVNDDDSINIQSDVLIKLMNKKGYDGFVYENKFDSQDSRISYLIDDDNLDIYIRNEEGVFVGKIIPIEKTDLKPFIVWESHTGKVYVIEKDEGEILTELNKKRIKDIINSGGYFSVFRSPKTYTDVDLFLSEKKFLDSWIAFYPEQIKLADGSNTTFDGSNPDIRYAGGGETQPRDLTKIDNYINIYKGAEFYSYSDNYEKQEKADRWFELFVINQKERQLNTIEFNEFIQLSNELSWEEFAKGGKVVVLPADIQKYKKIGVEDKYFIEASKDVGLQGINFDSQSILKRIESQFNDMLDNYKMYLINDDSPSITNYINNEIETNREQGSSLETIQRLEAMKENESSRRTIIDDIAKTQNESLEKWVDYLRLSEYTLPFKFLILKAVLNFNYDLKQNKLFERGRDTIRNFTPFDAGSLAELNEKKSDFLLMDYNVIMNENSSKILNSQEVVEQSGKGKWIKFNGGKKTKPEDIQKNGTRLMNLVQNTYWCTKSAGTRQLQGGDFYVYVTESNGEIFPRIAVRMNESEVGEVRGNRSSAQDLDAEMLPIAEDFLNKNIPNNSGKKWLDSIKYNKQCVEMRKRFEEQGMYKDFIYDYIKLIADKDKHKVDYGSNGNVTLLEQKFQEIIQVSNEYYQKGDIVTDYRLLSPNSIYFIGNLGRYELSSFVGLGDFEDFKLKCVSGNLEMSDNMMNLGNIEYIGGNLKINSNITNLGKVKFIGNMLSMADKLESLSNLESIGGVLQISKRLKDLGKLKKVGFLEIMGCDETFSFGSLEEIEGDLTIMEKSVDIDFGNLKTIGGNFNASNTIITDLKNLESVGGYFFIAGSKIKKFENLKSIGGNADFSNNFCPSTQNIETILGNIKFLNSRIMEFPKLNKIGGTIEFRGSFFKSFGNIKYIGGNLNLAESKIEDLGDLEYVGGYVSFKGCKVQTLNKLKKIVFFANFEGSDVTDLGDLESVGGNLYLRLSKIKSLGKLNYVGGIIYMMKNNYSGLEANYEEIQRQLTN